MTRGYRIWLLATTATTFGDAVTFFALGWIAAEHGPGAAGLVLTAGALPLCLLILVGGAIADRWGVRRTMIGCDLASAIVMGVFAAVVIVAVPVWSLAVLAFATGAIAALRRPAAGVFPRLFGRGHELARMLAQATMAQQIARTAGPAAGGLLLGIGGLTGVAALDVASCLFILAVLVVVRPPLEPPTRRAQDPLIRDLTATVTMIRTVPGLAGTAVAVAGLAVTILPLVSLCVPLVGHARGWSAGETGVVAGAWVVGGFVVTALVARYGMPGRRMAVAGPLPAALGAAGLALGGPLPIAVIGVGLVGIGTSMTTCRLIPRLLDKAPTEQLARTQAVLGLAQTAPVLLATPLLGYLGALTTPAVVTVVLAALLALTSVAVARTERVSDEVTAGLADDA